MMLNIRDFPFIALADDIFFPGMGRTFELSQVGEHSQALLAALATRTPTIALFYKKRNGILPSLSNLYPVGVLAVLRRVPGSQTLEAVITQRVGLRDITHHPHPIAQVQLLPEPLELQHVLEEEGDARARKLAASVFIRSGERGASSAELLDHFEDQKLDVIYFLASVLALSLDEALAVLNASTLTEAQAALCTAAQRLLDELDQGTLTSPPIKDLTPSEEAESGPSVDRRDSIRQLRDRFFAVDLDAPILARLLPELEKLSRFDPGVAEHQDLVSRLEGLLCFPWNTRRTERPDLESAGRVLDDEILGHDEAKARILDLYAARSLNHKFPLPLICVTGPTGVGKRTLSRGMAKAGNRPSQTILLGKPENQAQQLKGCPRNLPGGRPGAIYEAAVRAGNREALLIFESTQPLSDEAAEILTALMDPNNDQLFREDYLGLPIDTSLLVAVLVVRSSALLPASLLERALVLDLQGYSTTEKAALLRQRLWPAALARCGLEEAEACLDEPTVLWLITEHSQEAGVQNLCRALALLACRLARRKLQNRAAIAPALCLATVKAWFGQTLQLRSREGRAAGVVAQLSLTPSGAESLEVSVLPRVDQHGIGILGEASATVRDAFEVARTLAVEAARPSNAEKALLPGWQVRVPGGSLAEDENSLGLSLALALRSAETGQKISRDVAVVGRLDPAGTVLPVGSLRERALAAERAGFRRLVHPRGEAWNVADLRTELDGRLELVDVSSLEEAVSAMLAGDE